MSRTPAQTLVTDFFGNVAQVQVTDDPVFFEADSSSSENDGDQASYVESVPINAQRQEHSPSQLVTPSWPTSTFSSTGKSGTSSSLRAWGGLLALGGIAGWVARSSGKS